MIQYRRRLYAFQLLALALFALPLILPGLGGPGGARAVEVGAAVKTAAPEKKPYTIVGGKVDWHTYDGYRHYSDPGACLSCHGPDGSGSSFAPDLTQSLKTLSYEDFTSTVLNGKVVMPAFGENPNVVPYVDEIYAYLKARSDGAIGRGRPPHLPKAATTADSSDATRGK